MSREIVINRQLMGLEDLLFGVGIVTQIRAGQNVNVTRINAGNLPFDETQTLLEWAQSINLEVLGSITTELQAIYNNLPTIDIVGDNLTVINTLGTNITVLQSLYTNIAKLQNIDTNMPKLQNIGTNMSKLQNIDTNMSKLQAIYLDLTKLESIYDNLTMLTSIYNNLTALNNINSQVIPNLTELLLVNDNAAQVAVDKLTVATDKGIVAGYKNDVSAMKVAVETIYDTFDDRFLGVKSSDPTLDNDGNALLDGAMYFNSTSHLLKVYSLTNTTWYTIPQIYLSGLLDVTLTSITTGDILTWNGTNWVNTRTPSFYSIKLNGGTNTAGTATWNNTELTYDIQLNNNVSLQVGQEEVILCKNNTASLITNGRPVMAVGTNGNSGNILIDLHDGTKASAGRIVGIATENIAAGATGFVTRNGKVRGLNTTGSNYGETWLDGDILYVKATGALTKVEPADTALKMPIAFVIHAHTNGTLYVRTTGIDENHDRDLISNKIPKITTPITKAVTRIKADGTLENSAITIDDNGNIGSGTQTFNGFGGSGIKNRIINGGMDIWQRRVNFSLPNNETWTADRWKIGVTGAPVAQVYKGGQVFGYGLNTLAIDGSAGNTIFQLRQYIESLNCRDFIAGQKITVSFDVFTNAGFVAKDLGVVIERPGGLDTWSVSYDGIAQNVSLPSGVSSSKKSVTFTLPNSYFQWGLKLLFNLGTGLKAGETIAFCNVQLEVGSIATPFEQRPIGLELSLCQRYYQTIHTTFSESSSTIGGSPAKTVSLPTTMRTNPIVIEDNEGSGGVASVNFSSTTNTALRVVHILNATGWYRQSFYRLSAEL